MALPLYRGLRRREALGTNEQSTIVLRGVGSGAAPRLELDDRRPCAAWSLAAWKRRPAEAAGRQWGGGETRQLPRCRVTQLGYLNWGY